MTTRRTEIRVGVFVMGAILIGALTAFVIGKQRNVFDDFVSYRAHFRDVEGIRPGNNVRIAGLLVGSVTDVAFSNDGLVEVKFKVSARFVDRIRGNPRAIPSPEAEVPQPSRVSIGSKGMLGDKLIDISMGDPRLPPWPPARALPARSGGGLMETAARLMGEVEGTAQNLRSATDPLRDQEFTHDLERIAANLGVITRELAEGDGTLGRLLRDDDMGEDAKRTLDNLREASVEITGAARSFRAIADEIRRGDGSAHRLIYGSEGAAAVASIGGAADEFGLALRAVREGNGTLHRLLYEDEGAELLANLTRASDDIAHITADLREGRGTIGALLVDPSVFEDMKRLIGDLERNDILRALVRYSIRRDEATGDVEITRPDGEPAPEAPEPPEATSP